MKTNISTDNLQSQRLLRCGVAADTADMYYLVDTLHIGPSFSDVWQNKPKDLEPAWSLSALFGLLPKEIDIDGYPYRISIYFESPDEPVIGNQWCLYYKPKKNTEKSHRIDDVPMYATDLIECAVLMVEWLYNHGYKLNDCPCREKGGQQ